MIRNDPKRIFKGISARITNAIRKDQQWKWRDLNEWRKLLAIGLTGLVLGCIDPGSCPAKADETPFEHGQHIVLGTETLHASVTLDSTTYVNTGKQPHD